MQVYGNGISPWRLAPATRSVFGVRRFISAFNSHVSFIFNFALPQEQAGGPEGSERRTSGLRMAPGTSRTSPGSPRRWRRPVRLQGTSARGRGFAAYLPGCARQLFIVRCAHYARGASLTAFGFVTTVPRYLPKASNSLTFVRGANPRLLCAA